MAQKRNDRTRTGGQQKKDMASWRPGGEPEDAKDVGSKGDFGIPAGGGPSPDRDYVSGNTRASDPGAAQPMDYEHDGVRDHGAGTRDVGPGSGSGGDVDTDVIGVGTGGTGVAQAGPDHRRGPDDTDGTSNEFAGHLPQRRQGDAVIEPATGRGQKELIGKVGGTKRVKGSVVQQPDVQSNPDAQGADAATNPAARGDDSFVGEISSGEARGQDLGLPPSSDTQGLSDERDPEEKDVPDEG